MRPQNLLEHIQRRKTSWSSPVALGLMGVAGLVMLMQAPLMAEAATETGKLELKVLEASTSSGSQPKETAKKPQVQFEVIDVATGSGMGLKGQEEIVPAVTLAPAEAPPVVLAQNKSGAETAGSTAAKAGAGAPNEQNRAAIFAALDTWHQQTLATYNYNISSLADPFLPIKEVRGTQPDSAEDDEFKRRPPILQMTLSQLKLVAITTLSDRPGGALASFEDGAGASYILRQGDLIGRDNGRITSINGAEVTVEEQPRGSKSPRVTVLKLNVPSNTTGLTRESDQQPTQSAAPNE